MGLTTEDCQNCLHTCKIAPAKVASASPGYTVLASAQRRKDNREQIEASRCPPLPGPFASASLEIKHSQSLQDMHIGRMYYRLVLLSWTAIRPR